MNVVRPTLLVDEEKCRSNIARMQEKAMVSQAELRPHFKTHQSAKIASWYKDKGINKCTVSSVEMAKYFADHGWNDITIAFPYNPLEANEINTLAEKISVNILVESTEALAHAKNNISNTLGYFIKVDIGYHRTGVDPRDGSLLKKLATTTSNKLQYKGILAHAGHTYGAKGEKDIRWIFESGKKILLPLRDQFGGIVSFGDTPSCSIIEDLSAFDELRPGNFVFYDWMQKEIGSCQAEEIAVCLAAPVVAKHEERNEVVIYGGGVHLSKDSVGPGDRKIYGKVVPLSGGKWRTEIIGDVLRLSQEHGTLSLSKEAFEKVQLGTLVGILPIHSCLAADLQGHYLSTNGEKIDKRPKT